MFSGTPGILLGRVSGWKHWDEQTHAGNACQLETCWDFEYLVKGAPLGGHYRAFFAVCEKLRPALSHTMWLVGPDFRSVMKAMPALRGTNGFVEQYRSFMRRVRAASASRWISRGWWRIVTVHVQPVMNHGALMATLGRSSPWRLLSAVTRQCLLGLIREMVGWDRPGVFAGRPFRVVIGSLAAVGYGRTLREARKTWSAQVFRGGVGSFASLACTPFVGKIVRPRLLRRFWMIVRWQLPCWATSFSLRRIRLGRTVGTRSRCFTGRA